MGRLMNRHNAKMNAFAVQQLKLVAALSSLGFKHVHVERPDPKTRWNVIVATR
jgi:hypothetical protein